MERQEDKRIVWHARDAGWKLTGQPLEVSYGRSSAEGFVED